MIRPDVRRQRPVSLSIFEQRRVVQAGVLAAHRVGDRVFEAAGALPLARRAHVTVAADLIDAPVDLKPMIVRIAEFDGDLTAGAAAAGEVDLRAMPAQMVVRAQDLVKRRDLERDWLRSVFAAGSFSE